MASIHLARIAGPAGFEKPVALKIIHDHLAQDPQFVEMFLAEARIAATLNHPNIVQIYELGEAEGTYFIAMEYLAGENLADIIRRQTKTPKKVIDLRLGCQIILEACEGLHHAHETSDMEGRHLELVHRDISPQNLFVTYGGSVKLMDFGIARAAGLAAATRPGSLKGKFSYMSPEQARGKDINRRTDIFAMGIVLWELTTGRRLFKGANDFDTLARISKAEITPLDRFRPDVPPSLIAVAAKALARSPDERYQTAIEMHDELSEVAAALGKPVKGRELAKHMAAWFEKERAEKKALLSRAAKESAAAAPVQLPADAQTELSSAPPVDDLMTPSLPSGWRIPSVSHTTNAPLEPEPELEPEPDLELPRRRRWPLLVALVLVALVGGGVAAALVMGGNDSRAAGAAVPAASADLSPPGAEAPAAADASTAGDAVTLVNIAITASPPQATIQIDGEPVGSNPYRGVYPASSEEHLVVLEAEGFERMERTLRFDESQRLELALHPAPAKARRPGRRRPSKRSTTARSPAKTPSEPPSKAPLIKRPPRQQSDGEIYTVPPWER